MACIKRVKICGCCVVGLRKRRTPAERVNAIFFLLWLSAPRCVKSSFVESEPVLSDAKWYSPRSNDGEKLHVPMMIPHSLLCRTDFKAQDVARLQCPLHETAKYHGLIALDPKALHAISDVEPVSWEESLFGLLIR
jgi:hypothetical protein